MKTLRLLRNIAALFILVAALLVYCQGWDPCRPATGSPASAPRWGSTVDTIRTATAVKLSACRDKHVLTRGASTSIAEEDAACPFTSFRASSEPTAAGEGSAALACGGSLLLGSGPRVGLSHAVQKFCTPAIGKNSSILKYHRNVPKPLVLRINHAPETGFKGKTVGLASVGHPNSYST